MTSSTMISAQSDNSKGSYIHLTKAAASEDIGGTTPIVVGWDTEAHKDTGFTHDNVTNNSRVTVANTGRYSIKCTVSALNTEGAGDVFAFAMVIRVDGTTPHSESIARAVSLAGDQNSEITALIVTELELTADEYIEIVTQQEYEAAPGTPVIDTTNGECELIIRRIG